MKLPALLVSDPHFTANKQDEYRWGLWSWIRATCTKKNIRTLAILGDLTDAKDYHPAELVNRLVHEIDLTRANVENIVILKGNHDYLKDGHAFFEFLSCLPGVRFITRPHDSSSDGAACLWLPHTKSPNTEWQSLTNLDNYQFVFMHQTLHGARSSNGQAMEGEAMPDLSAAGKIYSGDIHVPQLVKAGHNEVEYVGSPYHVHFGDNFKPRCLIIDHDGTASETRFRTISRVTLDITADQLLNQPLDLREGDQVKVRVHLEAAEMHEWSRLQRAGSKRLQEMGVTVASLALVPPRQRQRFGGQEASSTSWRAMSPEEAVLGFVEREGLGAEALTVGLQVIES